MSGSIVFDIETYRPNWRVGRTRREDLDPAENSIVTVGFFDGKEASIYPVIQDLKEEGKPVEFFLRKLGEFQGSTLVGYNILRFDVPYLVYKARATGKDVDLTRFKLLDLFWVLPYWLYNVPTGIVFLRRDPRIGNLWSLSRAVEQILREKPNPIPNLEVMRLWETKQFNEIEKHLQLDLIHTSSLFESLVIQETLNHIQTRHFDRSGCKESCPFRQLLQKSSDRAICYCALLQDIIPEERTLSAIDVIDQPLPRRDISWIPYCIG